MTQYSKNIAPGTNLSLLPYIKNMIFDTVRSSKHEIHLLYLNNGEILIKKYIIVQTLSQLFSHVRTCQLKCINICYKCSEWTTHQ